MTSRAFLTISRDGSKVTLKVDTNLEVERPALLFEWETGKEMHAALLADRLRENYTGLIERARKSAYLAGYKDGRGKKQQRSWWPSWLGWGYDA